MTGLPDGRKSFKIGLVVLIQYRLWQTATHPASHVAVAIRLYVSRRAQKQTARFRTYSRLALCDLPQSLLGDRARRSHQKGVIHFLIQRIVFPTGCTEKYGLINLRAVSQQ